MGLLDSRMHRWALATAVGAAVLVALPWLAEAAATGLDAGTARRFQVVGAFLALFAVLLWFSPDPHDVARPEIVRRYYREALIPIAVYVPLSLVLRQVMPDRTTPEARTVSAVLFLTYLALLTRAFVRYVRDSDELQRRIELESIAIGSLAVCALFTVAQFLQRAEVIALQTDDALGAVFPASLLAYSIARVVHGRRYQ